MTKTVHFVTDTDHPWVKLHQRQDAAPGQNGQFMPQGRESAKQRPRWHQSCCIAPVTVRGAGNRGGAAGRAQFLECEKHENNRFAAAPFGNHGHSARRPRRWLSAPPPGPLWTLRGPCC